MTNQVLFWTQIGSVLVFVVTLFVLYRVLVQSKDSTIESLRQEVRLLERHLEATQHSRPDVLAERLKARNEALTEELELLSSDQKENESLIQARETELLVNQAELEQLRRDLDRAKDVLDELTCPTCGAIVVERGYASEPVHYQGQELDLEHEWLVYECGLRILDGVEKNPCPEAQTGG